MMLWTPPPPSATTNILDLISRYCQISVLPHGEERTAFCSACYSASLMPPQHSRNRQTKPLMLRSTRWRSSSSMRLVYSSDFNTCTTHQQEELEIMNFAGRSNIGITVKCLDPDVGSCTMLLQKFWRRHDGSAPY